MLAATTIFWDRPWILVGLVLLMVPGFLAQRAEAKGQTSSRRSVGLRAIAIIAVVFALAGMQMVGPGGSNGPWLVMTDISGSTRTQHDTPVTFDDTRAVNRVYFAASPTVPGQPVDDSRTDIASALDVAVREVADGTSGVVIVTDGRFNGSPWYEQAEALRATGVPVRIVPMDAPPADARILSFSGHRDGDQVRLRARFHTTDDMDILGRAFRIRPNLEMLGAKIFTLPAQQVTHTGLKEDLSPDRAGIYEFALDGSDDFPENNSATVLLPPANPRILILAQDPAPWASAVEEITGIDTEERTFQGCPPNADLLTDFSAIVLVDSTGHGLASLQRSAIAQFVHTGGGLVLIGAGPYTSPADLDDPLNEVSALLADPSRRRPLDLVVLLDRSGSMGEVLPDGTSPFDKARQATESLQEQLTDGDALRIIAFADTARTVFDSGTDPIDWTAVHETLVDVEPAGGTNAGTALQAGASLPSHEGKHRMLLLVSDLDTEPFDANSLAAEIAQTDTSLAIIKVYASEVLTGPYGTPAGMAALHALAEQLRAPSITLQADFTVKSLSAFFGTFIMQSRGEPVRRGEFADIALTLPHISRSAMMPPLTSHMIATPTGDDVVVLSSSGSDPLLAARSVGLGRSITLAIPMETGQNNAWMRDRDFKSFVGAMVEWARNQRQATILAGGVETLPTGERMLFVATDPSKTLELPNDMKLVLHPPMDDQPTITLTPEGRGAFTAPLPAGWEGQFLEVRDAQGTLLFGQSMRSAGNVEFQRIGPDWKMLQELATRTGGELLDNRTVLTRQEAPRKVISCWPGLMVLGVVAMLIDWLGTKRGSHARTTTAD
jgi:hypothetical protein